MTKRTPQEEIEYYETFLKLKQERNIEIKAFCKLTGTSPHYFYKLRTRYVTGKTHQKMNIDNGTEEYVKELCDKVKKM